MRLDDASLLFGNPLRSIAQKLHVVHADVGNDAHDRCHDIGTVQPSAQTCFDDGKINFFMLEIVEGHSRSQLEERGVDRFDQPTVAFDKIHYVLLWDFFSVYPYPFTEVGQMWRSI